MCWQERRLLCGVNICLQCADLVKCLVGVKYLIEWEYVLKLGETEKIVLFW